MSAEPGSLAALRDLALPTPVSFWPPAPGVWIVMAGLLAALAVAAWRAAEQYRKDAYRREAVRALDLLAVADPAGRSVGEVAAILKRTALVAYSRPAVASLSGATWGDVLARTGGAAVDGPRIRTLPDAAFGPAPSASEMRDLIDQARRWVKSHRAARPEDGGPC